MFDELTQVDIKKIQEEIDYRTGVLRTQIHEDIVAAKEFGDLSENAEYKEARRAKGQNESRITYLQNMLRTAKIIQKNPDPNIVGIFDKVEVFFEAEGENNQILLASFSKIFTAGLLLIIAKIEILPLKVFFAKHIIFLRKLKRDASKNIISNQSPLGKAIYGKKLGDRAYVEIEPGKGYYVQIKNIEKGEDDESLPITKY